MSSVVTFFYFHAALEWRLYLESSFPAAGGHHLLFSVLNKTIEAEMSINFLVEVTTSKHEAIKIKIAENVI
jgi:hypothetical protein